MKNLNLLILTLFFGIFSVNTQAQTLSITGNVHDISSGTNVGPGYMVNLELYSGGLIFADSTFTDSSGNFFFNPNPGTTQGIIVVYTYDCTGGIVLDSAGFFPGPGGNTANFTLNICVGSPPCTANFYINAQGLAVSFTNASTGGSVFSPLSYSWDFGDGNTSTAVNPNHTYASPGTYTICLIASDNLGCADSTCATIVITNTPPPTCSALFTYGISGTGIQFMDSSTTAPQSTYFWSFGDSTTSTAQNPSHTYAASGTYTVCLTITAPGGCTDTYCETITVGMNPPSCTASFTYSMTGAGVQFAGASTGSAPFTYAWDFGDNTASTMQSPNHSYTSSGTYSVCLTITDANGCSDTHCQTITISLAPASYNISGLVTAGNSPAVDGIAYLIVHDSTGTLTAVDTAALVATAIGTGYTFFNVNPGTYLIKVALNPADPNYAGYLPTYLGDELNWSNATSSVVTNSTISGADIHLIAGVNPGGPGFIGGLISQGANKGPGDPLSDVSVLIFDSNDNPVDHTMTNANGEYSFSNLAYGTYNLMVEIAGKISESWEVTLDGNNGTFNDANFEVGDINITVVDIANSLEKFAFGEVLGVYPNPAINQVQVNVSFTQPSKLSYELVNMLGQTIDRQDLGTVLGSKNFDVNVSQLPRGTYLLKLQSGNQIISKRIVKQ